MEQVVSKDGTAIGYVKRGAGPPLLLVHGATADHQRWTPISPRFEEGFRVYAMDRRGRGMSGDGPAYHVAREAEDVAAVVDSIGEPVSVLAHSYGALCSLEAALLTTEMHRLVLYEPPVPGDAPAVPLDAIERIQALADRGELEAALEVMMVDVVRMPPHELAAYRQLPMWKVRIALAPTIARELSVARTYRFDAERFAHLRVPTLLLLGGDSPPHVRRATEIIDATLPNSRVAILPGQQHIAMDTSPELFAGEVLRFLQEQ